MKIRRYTCKDMQEALLKVKMDLGSEAVIMNSRKVKPKGFLGLFQKPMIEVVAAIDDDYVRPRPNAFQNRQTPAYPSVQQPQQVPSQPQPFVQPVVPASSYSQAPQPQTSSVHQQEALQTPAVAYRQAAQAYQAEAAHREEARNVEEPKLANKTNSSDHPDRQVINELENKVKSMESMLEQIFKVVQGKENPPKDSLPKESFQEGPSAFSSTSSSETENDNLNILGQILLDHDVEPKLIEKILDKIKERGSASLKLEEVVNLAARVMTVLLGEPEPLKLKEDKRPHVAIFIGPTGVGKTTTLAKIAADFTLNRQKKVGLITADTYRIAAVEQLKTYAEILNLPVSVVYSPNEIKDAIERLSDNDLILIDTAGRSHKNQASFNELKTLVNAVNADETYLVMSCNTGRIAVKEILEYYAFIKNYKLLFTKLDESPVPGVILNARYMTGKPLSYTTAGQSVPDDLDVADIKQLVSGILAKPGI